MPGERDSISSPCYHKNIRGMLSPFIYNKINTGHVGTDLDVQDVVVWDLRSRLFLCGILLIFLWGKEKKKKQQVKCRSRTCKR